MNGDLDDDLNDLYSDLDQPAPAPRFRMRVVLVDPAPAFDKEAERNKLLQDEIGKVVQRGNRALGAIGQLARFGEFHGRLIFECYNDAPFDAMDETTFSDLRSGLAALFYDIDPPEEHMGSKVQGMRRYADAIYDLLSERVNRAVMSAEVKARARSPVESVKEEPLRKMIEAALGDLAVAGPETPDQVDEVFAEVHAQCPWFSTATSELWRAMRHEVEQGRPPWFRPIILVGEPGVGKTTLGRVIAAELGTPLVEVDAGSGGAAFSIAGLEKGWSTAGIGRPLEAILRHRVANPLVMINELDRIGGGMVSNSGSSRTSMNDALLPLLDRESARNWTCPASRVAFNMSNMMWILTTNSLTGVDPALLSRCMVFTVPRPDPDHVAQIVRERLGALDPDLAAEAAAMVAREWSRRAITLRQVDAMVDRIGRALTGPRLH